MTDVGVNPLRELVEAHRDEIKKIVARHGGRSIAIFGSVARGDERPGNGSRLITGGTRLLANQSRFNGRFQPLR